MNIDPKTLFRGIGKRMPVIAAVSGGSDSVALLLLAAAWARHSGANLQVASVDHGLRPEAAAEAAFVASLCEALNVSHVTLSWDGIKPISGVSEAAREARYRLLEEFASDIGASTILTGHTANDQAETIAMRLKREGGGRGLSGMGGVTLLPGGTRLVRPLLKLSREQLRQYLRDHHQGWIEDPSNFDASYERVRIRRELEKLPHRMSELCRFGDVMARFRRVMAQDAARVLVQYLKMNDGPVYTFAPDDIACEDQRVLTTVLQVVIAIAGGAEYFVPAKSLLPVIEHLKKTDGASKSGRAGKNEMHLRLTLGRTVIECKTNRLRIYRETRNLPAMLIGPGDRVIWDGRLMVENNTSATLFCGPVEAEQIEDIEAARGGKLPVNPRAAIRSMPYLRADGDEIYLPHVRGYEVPPGVHLEFSVRAVEHFCPEFDFALLNWLGKFRDQFSLIRSLK